MSDRPRTPHGLYERVGGGKGDPISLRLPLALDLALRDWLGYDPGDRKGSNERLRDWVTAAIKAKLKQEVAEYDDAAGTSD